MLVVQNWALFVVFTYHGFSSLLYTLHAASCINERKLSCMLCQLGLLVENCQRCANHTKLGSSVSHYFGSLSMLNFNKQLHPLMMIKSVCFICLNYSGYFPPKCQKWFCFFFNLSQKPNLSELTNPGKKLILHNNVLKLVTNLKSYFASARFGFCNIFYISLSGIEMSQHFQGPLGLGLQILWPLTIFRAFDPRWPPYFDPCVIRFS